MDIWEKLEQAVFLTVDMEGIEQSYRILSLELDDAIPYVLACLEEDAQEYAETFRLYVQYLDAHNAKFYEYAEIK